jgi:hypothetical protein
VEQVQRILDRLLAMSSQAPADMTPAINYVRAKAQDRINMLQGK